MRLNFRCIVPLIVCVVLGCASGGDPRPAGIPKADVEVRSVGPVFFGLGRRAPLTLEATITNTASVPIVLRSLRLSSPGMLDWAIRPVVRLENETLAPGETETFMIAATAVASRRARPSPLEPLTLRADVDFEVNGERFREIYNFTNLGWS